MLREKDIGIELRCHQFLCKCYMRDMAREQSVLLFESEREAKEVRSRHCWGGGKSICKRIWERNAERYARLVRHGAGTHFCMPPIRVRTVRKEVHRGNAAAVSRDEGDRPGRTMDPGDASVQGIHPSIQGLTGIHWETISNLHLKIMESTLEEHLAKLKANVYQPRLLAVDEFAIHKGHTYATYIGPGNRGSSLGRRRAESKEDFERFFTETNPSIMSEVMAVAMDMNASYHILVRKHLPNAEIVYDRYHM